MPERETVETVFICALQTQTHTTLLVFKIQVNKYVKNQIHATVFANRHAHKQYRGYTQSHTP